MVVVDWFSVVGWVDDGSIKLNLNFVVNLKIEVRIHLFFQIFLK